MPVIQKFLFRLALLLFAGQPMYVLRMLSFVREAGEVILDPEDDAALEEASDLIRGYYRHMDSQPWSVRWRFLVLYMVLSDPITVLSVMVLLYGGFIYLSVIAVRYIRATWF